MGVKTSSVGTNALTGLGNVIYSQKDGDKDKSGGKCKGNDGCNQNQFQNRRKGGGGLPPWLLQLLMQWMRRGKRRKGGHHQQQGSGSGQKGSFQSKGVYY